MILLDIIFSLWWVWVPILLGWLIYNANQPSSKNSSKPTGYTLDEQRDARWHSYISSFGSVVKTKAEKNLIEALLNRKTPSQLYSKEQPQTTAKAQTLATKSPIVALQSVKDAKKPSVASQPIDNTLLLLYFGAFLLVASAGLFVAIGKFDGLIRTIGVAMTAVLLYIGGLWIYKTKAKLTQAGISFMGTGMMIAPLTGVAWYSLVSNQSSGAIIWLVTSLVCLALYFHALSIVDNSFISYLLIGSFVSSVESAVLSVSLPTYVFAWTAILISLALQLISLRRSQTKYLLQASDTSAQLLVPLSILGSLVLLPSMGKTQLACTLLLSGVYYAVLAWNRPAQRYDYASAAQISVIAALCDATYSVWLSVWSVAATLGILAIAYSLVIASAKLRTITQYNLIAIGALCSGISIILALPNAWVLVANVVIGLVLSAVIWLKLKSSEALIIGGTLLLALPFIAGQYALQPHISASQQLLLSSLPVLIHFGLMFYTIKKTSLHHYYHICSMLLLGGVGLLVLTAWLAGFTQLLLISVLVSVVFVLAQYISKDSEWWIVSGAASTLPMFFALTSYGAGDRLFSLSVCIAVVSNIAISLKTRHQTIRWILVGCILAMPIAVGGGGIGIHWQNAGFAGGYLLAMAGCILARAIARGKLLVSSKVPVSSYDEAASQAFIFGYIAAASIAVATSLFDANTRLVSSLVLAVVTAMLVYVVYKIENNKQALTLLPFLLQSILFSCLRPDLSDALILGTTAVLSSVLSLGFYTIACQFIKAPMRTYELILKTTVITSYLGPILILFNSNSNISSLVPLALALAGSVTIYHNRTAIQSVKELSTGVVIASFHWYLYLQGIHNIYIHSHLLALSLAGFAIWRSSVGDAKGVAAYVKALFLVATVPLALQALAGESGGSYGLLLIVQQAGFMVVGAITNQKFLLKGGMWVALAAILYQLRGLGWAFLSLLAVVLIGLAIYRLQKHEDNQTKN